MQLTLCAETLFTDLPLAERCQAMRALGISSVELWGLPGDRLATVSQALRSANCDLAVFCGNRDHSLIDPDDRDGFLAELRQSIEHARTLGCSRLTVLSDRVDERGIPIPPARPLLEEEKFASLRDGLAAAARLAEAADVTLLMEPLNTRIDHPGYTLCDSARAFELAREINSPRLRVLYDLYHSHVMGDNLLATLEAQWPWIGHIHVADVPGRHEPSTGEIGFRSIAGLLRQRGYSHAVGLECMPRGSSADAVRAFLKIFG